MTPGVTNDTPVAMLTVGQLKEALGIRPMATAAAVPEQVAERRYVYGIRGIAGLFGCSLPTANRIKASGKIDKALRQVGRKIIVDADLALDLAGLKAGGRR
jgi:hypothetical protein